MEDPKSRGRYEASRIEWVRLRVELDHSHAVLGTGDQPLEEEAAVFGTTVHHLVPRSLGGDDYLWNLVALTGSGTTAMHGQVTAANKRACGRLRDFLEERFPEKIAYVVGRKSFAFLDRYYPAWEGS